MIIINDLLGVVFVGTCVKSCLCQMFLLNNNYDNFDNLEEGDGEGHSFGNWNTFSDNVI